MNAIALSNGKHLDLIRRTVAKDCNTDEFSLFIENAKAMRLDPLRRQIYAFVFSKDDAKKRQMTIVTSIGGYRSIAERTGNYRPGPTETITDASLISPTNPKGISHALATVFKFTHGEWHPVTERADWEEFAPIKDEWQDNRKTGRKVLDPKKDGWHRMPRVMIEKCAEAKVLRRAWPDDFAGLYSEEEMDQAVALDLSAAELADAAAAEAKLELIGGKDALTLDWCDGSPLARVPFAKFPDAVLEYANRADVTETELRVFWHRNLPARGEFKAKAGHDYLELQKVVERIGAAKAEAEARVAAE